MFMFPESQARGFPWHFFLVSYNFSEIPLVNCPPCFFILTLSVYPFHIPCLILLLRAHILNHILNHAHRMVLCISLLAAARMARHSPTFLFCVPEYPFSDPPVPTHRTVPPFLKLNLEEPLPPTLAVFRIQLKSLLSREAFSDPFP